MIQNSQLLLQKKEELVKQIEDNFLVVDKKDVQKKLGMSKQLMDYHLRLSGHHTKNMDVLEKIVLAQQEFLKSQNERLDELMETAKTITA